MQNFRKLKVWIRANDLAPRVRNLTDGFPKTGYRSLREQVIDATESIPFNIAEGCGASSPKEFARFLEIAIKSSNEVDAELQLALDYGIVADREALSIADEVIQIRMMLTALRKRVLSEQSKRSSRRE